MSKGSIKKQIEENAKAKEYSLDNQEFNYLKNLENVKQTLIGAIDLYINTAQIGFLQYLSSHKFNLDPTVQYQFDVDLETPDDEPKKVSVIKVNQ